MPDQTFSQRYGYSQPPELLDEDKMPDWLGNQIIAEIQKFINERYGVFSDYDAFNSLVQSLKPLILATLQQIVTGRPSASTIDLHLFRLFHQTEWWKTYDVCEAVASHFRKEYGVHEARPFERDLNGI